MKRVVYALMLFMFFACSGEKQVKEQNVVKFFSGTFNQAVTLAGSSSKHILVDFYTDW